MQANDAEQIQLFARAGAGSGVEHYDRLASDGAYQRLALHLVLEVLAYAADEAEGHGGATSHVTLGADGSISVADDGRGTDTRLDANLIPVEADTTTATTMTFWPTSSVAPSITNLEVTPQALGIWPPLTVAFIDHRTTSRCTQ